MWVSGCDGIVKMKNYTSWGRYPNINQHGVPVGWRDDQLPDVDDSLLPYGQGRSYGDCCLNENGILLDTAELNRFIFFDKQLGILRCESGVTLDQVLQLIVPHGWFLPVTPGTRFVSVGGAIANDVHGKNHHSAGTFGCHLNAFELLRSDGQRLVCSSKENSDYYNATIAGMGLTGLITWAEIKLKPIKSTMISGESIRFNSLTEFFSLSEESDGRWEYTVSWIDGSAKGDNIGRGIFYRGNHADDGGLNAKALESKMLNVNFDAPEKLLNKMSVSAFNNIIYNKHSAKRKTFNRNIIPFFYPLDKIGNWNRLYGKSGFLQFQCVVPLMGENEENITLKHILNTISDSGAASFLAVLKVFGDSTSPGLMSFPRKGVTLALDFPFRGQKTLTLINKLDDLVCAAGGAVYPAKDACMKADNFKKYFPQYKEFIKMMDPKFSSSLWRRVYE